MSTATAIVDSLPERTRTRISTGTGRNGVTRRSGGAGGTFPTSVRLPVASCSRSGTRVAVVARALTNVYRPCHLNYDLLGNLVRHVHVHIVSRFEDDPCPNTPLTPWVLHSIDDDELVQQSGQLRRMMHTA